MFDKIKNVFKFKKVFKKKIKAFKFSTIELGIIGVRALESARLTPKQLEAVRRVVIRKTQRLGKFWLRAHIDQPLTRKAKGSRMGKGIGDLDL
jgi:large subunit ribosomal protein L16